MWAPRLFSRIRVAKKLPALDKDLPIYHVEPWRLRGIGPQTKLICDYLLAGVMARHRLLLACTGIYAVTTYRVQRTSELGIDATGAWRSSGRAFRVGFAPKHAPSRSRHLRRIRLYFFCSHPCCLLFCLESIPPTRQPTFLSRFFFLQRFDCLFSARAPPHHPRRSHGSLPLRVIQAPSCQWRSSCQDGESL